MKKVVASASRLREAGRYPEGYQAFFVLIALIASVVIGAGASFAEKLKEPTVEYSAVSTMETESFTMKGKLYHAGKKERREMAMGGGKNVSIMRGDKKVMWMLMPEQKMYMENSLEGGSSKQEDPSDMDIEATVVGPETVNGIPATKNKVIARRKDGSVMGGFNWITKDGIVVKMDLIGKTEGRKGRIKMELSDLRIGKQDPSLFEIPAGYNRMDMGGMMGGGLPGMPDMGSRKRKHR